MKSSLVAALASAAVAGVLAACGGSIDTGIGNSSGGSSGGGSSGGGSSGGGSSGSSGVACPAIAFDCAVGAAPTDTNSDGCVAIPKKDAGGCPEIVPCPPNTLPADDDGDGCTDACKPSSCSPMAIDCAQGFKLVDTDGDGCGDSCKPQ